MATSDYKLVESRRFGLAKESVRGTAESAPTKWYPILKESDFDVKRSLLKDDTIRGVPEAVASIAGRKVGTGRVRLPLDGQTIGEFLYSLLGADTPTEEATVTISDSNKFFDFNIGATELNATIATGSYKLGLTQADTGTLCKVVYDAIHAAEAVGTYTVSYSRTTHKFTITRSAGSFTILWKTGTHGADNTPANVGLTLGFAATADASSALSYTGENEVAFSMTHAMVRSTSSLLPPSYTFFLDRGLNVLRYNFGVVHKLSFTGPVDGLIMADATIHVQDETSGSIGSPTFPSQKYMDFSGTTIKVGGSQVTNVKTWSLDIESGASPLLKINASSLYEDIICKGGFRANGSFTCFFENATERDKFLAGTTNSLEIIVEGPVIAGTSKYGLDVTMPAIQYTAYPYDEEEGLLAAKVTYDAVYDSGTGRSIAVNLTNTVAAY